MCRPAWPKASPLIPPRKARRAAGVVAMTVSGVALSRRLGRLLTGAAAISTQVSEPGSLKLDFCHASWDTRFLLEQGIQKALDQP